jgi:hypothetical protein
MFMRIFSFTLLLLGAACSDQPMDAKTAAAEGRILCATRGQSGVAPDCTLERSAGPEGAILTIRHPDGGFRRLAIAKDGRGVVAADGAEPAVVTPLSDGLIEVALGDARYRLPATVKASR